MTTWRRPANSCEIATLEDYEEGVDFDRQTWNSVLRLALIVSVIAAVVAIAVSAAGDVPQAAIVLPVIVVAFTASWVQSGRARRRDTPVRVAARRQRAAAPIA